MADSVTSPTDVAVAEFIAGVEPEARRAEALVLDALFRRVTGWAPVMWGPSIIGYGSYSYRYDSGREGRSLATGFSPRKAEISIYAMGDLAVQGEILQRLGKHKQGKSCLYLKRLSDADPGALEDLVRASLAELAGKWTLSPS